MNGRLSDGLTPRKGGDEGSENVYANAEKKLRYVFKFFDYDGGNTIGEDELVGLLALLAEQEGAELRVDELMKQFSRRDCRELEFKDMLELLRYCKNQKDIKPKARDIFAFFDRNETECITKFDLLQTMSVLGEETCDQEVEEMINEARVTHGRGIDEESFYALLHDLNLIDKPSGSSYLHFNTD